MIRRHPHAAALAAALLSIAAPATAARAQSPSSVADRVASARDGEVRLSYAARAGACGNGRDVVGFGHALYVHNSIESWGRWSGVDCAAGGPVRVTLTRRGRAVEGLRVRVGGPGAATEGVTELGAVSARAAADYFLSLAGAAESGVAKEAVLAAALADSADVAPVLLRIARDTTRPSQVRRRAVQWVGELGGAGVVRDLDALASRAGDDRKVREAALAALANTDSDAAVQALVSHARNASSSDDGEWMQKSAVFWLGQTGSPLARRTLRAIVDSAAAPERVRSAAIFAIGHGDDVTSDDIAFLKATYSRVDGKKLKDQILMAVSQQSGGDGWLLERARDTKESVESRKQAIFWAGQGGASVKSLADLYAALDERELKEHVVFALSQRDESAATDQLITIARHDPDPALRKRALFWLGQKNDPRAADLIRDMVMH
ncbi:MAG TPA: hypothetical protein VFJ74_13935 [Gemmatimonadaceae bacterium]|nr:hypothetical protein [Gemmatimonadaceae bacterium]